MKSRDNKSMKKTYHRPRLRLYGDLPTLTRAAACMDKPNDGAPKGSPMGAS